MVLLAPEKFEKKEKSSFKESRQADPKRNKCGYKEKCSDLYFNLSCCRGLLGFRSCICYIILDLEREGMSPQGVKVCFFVLHQDVLESLVWPGKNLLLYLKFEPSCSIFYLHDFFGIMVISQL